MNALLILIVMCAVGLLGMAFGWVTGRVSVTAKDLLKTRRALGITREHTKIYAEAMKKLNSLVGLDDLRDLTADPEEQVILPSGIREDIRALLARYRKEKIGEA